MIRARLLLPLNGQRDVQAAADALTGWNRYYRHTRPGTPLIYDGFGKPVRYIRETGGPEEWQSIPYILASGQGDCEDLASARAAELPGARAVVVRSGSGYHVVVRHADGTYEDPSRRLGM